MIPQGTSLSGPVTTPLDVVTSGTLNAPLTTTGNYTQTATGTLSVIIDPDTTTTVSGIEIAGTASLDGNLQVLQLAGSNDQNFAAGNTFEVLTADGGVSGQFANVAYPVTPNATIVWSTSYNP